MKLLIMKLMFVSGVGLYIYIYFTICRYISKYDATAPRICCLNIYVVLM